MRLSVHLLFAATLTVALSACAQQQPGMSMTHGAGMQGGGMQSGMASGGGSQQMHAQMMGGMQQMQGMPLSGDTDKDFVQMMRMHHLQGIEMARLELQKGKDAQAKEMAQKIVDSQKKDVEQFDQWLQRHR